MKAEETLLGLGTQKLRSITGRRFEIVVQEGMVPLKLQGEGI